MPYEILRHRDFSLLSRDLPLAVRRKADWAIVQLGVRGRTPSTKGTIGHPLPWRRSPVQGSHYYLWWLNAGDSGLHLNGGSHPEVRNGHEGAIFVHSIRHHDETDKPIGVGEVEQYEALDLADLDPRFDDQADISLNAQEGNVSVVVVEGMPGSGKSVALLYLARDLALRPGTGKVRYITYTEGLKRAAREVRDSLGPEVAERITVQTINDVVKQIAGREVKSDPFGEIVRFTVDVERLPAAQAGLWKSYPLTLYTELRAQVVGRTFPKGYHLPAHRDEELRSTAGKPDAERFAKRRKLDQQSASQLLQLAEKYENRYFLDQIEARAALTKLVNSDKAPPWVLHSDAFIIDEIQDFTPLQIALIAEMAGARLRDGAHAPLSITVAGDESQIVQPTGFTWGLAKDILHKRLNVLPYTKRFESQRRSPPLLGRLTQKSWELYSTLPKDLRPSAAQVPESAPSDVDALADSGLVVIAPPPADAEDPQWRALLAELAARPGRALVDLSEETEAAPLITLLAGVPSFPAVDESSDVLFKAREIKGLERGTVIIHGLQQTWEKLEALTAQDDGDRVPLLEARRLIDQMRVALSRSTSRLVILEAPDASIFAKLDFIPSESALQLSLGDLVELLQGDQMTDAEMVLSLIDESADLAGRQRLEDALRRNRRAAAIALQTTSTDVVRNIHLQEADLLVEMAFRDLDRTQIGGAKEAYQLAAARYAEVDPAAIVGERSERWNLLRHRLENDTIVEFAQLAESAERALAAGRVAEASDLAASALILVLPGVDEGTTAGAPLALGESEEERVRIRNAIALRLRANLALAEQLSNSARSEDSAAIAALMTNGARLRTAQGMAAAAKLLDALGARYSALPARSQHQAASVRALIEHANPALHALALLPPAAELALEREAAVSILTRWLEEAYADLGNHLSLYHLWAAAAVHMERAGGYPPIDERIWDLEQRYEASGAPPGPFAAFRAAYNGDPASASVIWEQLGELDMAVDAAREAGEFERAFTLLQSNHRTPPEELATARRALRLIQQLQHKHHNLRPGERRALAEELARLHTALTGGDEDQ